MFSKPTVPEPVSHPPLRLGLHPPQAWLAILAFVTLTALAILVGAGQVLNLAFPAGALIVGLFLYFRYPIFYMGFTWWIWLLSPLVRRLADYQGRFTEPSPILLAPYLVTLLTLLTLWRYFPSANSQRQLPFVLALISVFYGYLLGLIQVSPIKATSEFLEWSAPILMGFYLYIHWQDYPTYRRNIQRVFVWGVLLTGAYGVFQFLVAPAWDCFWLINADMNSIGRPAPLEIRVWSTMNAPGPFASFMMAGLLLLFLNKGPLKLPAMVVGYLAFLLSLVRSSWGAWFLGLLILASSMNLKFQVRLIVTALAISILVVPLVTIEPFAGAIQARFETFSNLEKDGSGEARKAMYSEQLGPALTRVVGKGVGSPGFDSGFINTLLSLGWIGTAFYMGGLFMALLSLYRGDRRCVDPFINVCRAIVLPLFVALLFGSFMLGIPGVLLWGFLGLGMAALRYHRHQLSRLGNQPMLLEPHS
jgi:hypothetical protein